MVYPKMDASHNFAVIPKTTKTLWIGFGDLCGHAKPCFECGNARSFASRDAALKALDPLELARPTSQKGRLSGAVKVLKRSVP